MTRALPLLEIDGASVVRGDAAVLDRLTIRVLEGQHTAILGPNGAGKSTLIAMIFRELYPLHGGQVRIWGEERWRVADLRQTLGLVSPAAQRDLAGDSGGRLKVFDAVASSFFSARGLWRGHELDDRMRTRTEEVLKQAGVAHLAHREVATLSSGEARRTLIARALVHRPRALLLDEPCQGLDPGTRRHFLEDLRKLGANGITLIMVTHHIEEVLPEISQVVLLKAGQVVASGSKDELLTEPILSDLFGADVHLSRSGDWYWPRFG